MGLLSEIFGESGGLVTNVFGFSFFVALFILVFFLLMLFVNGVSAESISLYVLLFVILISIDNIFNVPAQIISVLVVFALLFVAIVFYNFFRAK